MLREAGVESFAWVNPAEEPGGARLGDDKDLRPPLPLLQEKGAAPGGGGVLRRCGRGTVPHVGISGRGRLLGRDRGRHPAES